MAELACVEELLGMMNRRRLINDSVILILMNLFSNPEVTSVHRQNCLKLFSFLVKEKRRLLEDHVPVLMKVALGPLGQVH